MEVVEEVSSIDKLVEIVDENSGIVTVTMRALRNAYGSDRLGVHVRAGLSRELKRAGLGHQPQELPDNQLALARIYKRGSPVSELIAAARSINTDSDQLLRERAGSEASDTLQKIREMICG